MTTLQTDVAIIGAGTAGLNARRAAERNGARAVMVDPGPLGTTCARVGCMPSKLLIAAAETAHHAREGGVFGVDCTVSVEGPRVLARVRRERDRFTGFVLDACAEHEAKGRLLRGRARLVGPQLLRIADDQDRETARLAFRTLVVATGSSTFTPPPYRGLPPELVLTNETVFEQPDLPESVLVAGTGVIALELGQALHRLGVRVTLVGIQGLLGPLQDPFMRALAIRTFSEELDLHPDFTLHSLEPVEGGVRARFSDPDGSTHEGTWARVLMAAGRAPNLRGLDLELAGVEVPARGVPAFDPHTMQVGRTHVFLAGDVTGDRPLLHEASDEGEIAGENAARWPEVATLPRRPPLGVVFCDPQIATVGAPWSAVDGPAFRMGEIDYSDQGRARCMNQHKGWVRVYGEVATRRIAGAEMVGPRVEHTAHLLAWAVQAGLTVDQALAMPFYHPVVEEGIRTALRDLRANLDTAR